MGLNSARPPLISLHEQIFKESCLQHHLLNFCTWILSYIFLNQFIWQAQTTYQTSNDERSPRSIIQQGNLVFVSTFCLRVSCCPEASLDGCRCQGLNGRECVAIALCNICGVL